MFRDSVKGTEYPLYSPVSPSLPLPCVTVCHRVSTGLYVRDEGVPLCEVYFLLFYCTVLVFRRGRFDRNIREDYDKIDVGRYCTTAIFVVDTPKDKLALS